MTTSQQQTKNWINNQIDIEKLAVKIRRRQAAESEINSRPSCFKKKLGNEACFNTCKDSEECYE